VTKSLILEKVLEQLGDWREFPSYQFERRVDAMIGVFLSDVVLNVLRNRSKSNNAASKVIDSSLRIIPEFPVEPRKRRLKADGKPKNSSMRVDFGLVDVEGKTLWLLELKTDVSTDFRKQIGHLNSIATRGVSGLVDHLARICKKTEQQKKYCSLLLELEQCGIRVFSDENAVDGNARSLSDWRVGVVLLVPKLEKGCPADEELLSDVEVIEFEEFILNARKSPIAQDDKPGFKSFEELLRKCIPPAN